MITDLDVHIPAESVWDGIMADTADGVPAMKMSRFLKLRRRLRTRGSRNDALALAARAALPHGSLTSNVIGPHETVRVEPQEKVARPFPPDDRKDSPSYMPQAGELSNPITFVPSCKVANHKPLVWGQGSEEACQGWTLGGRCREPGAPGGVLECCESQGGRLWEHPPYQGFQQ